MNTRKAVAAGMLAALTTLAASSALAQTPTATAGAAPAKQTTAATAKTGEAAAKTAKSATKTAEAAAPKAGARSVIGEIVDPACWIVNGAKGESHKECAIACAKAGQTLAILEKKTGKLYYALTDKPGEDSNKGLIDYVAQTVLVKGKVFTRGGAVGIKVTSVEPYTALKTGE